MSGTKAPQTRTLTDDCYACRLTPDGTVTMTGVVSINDARDFNSRIRYHDEPFCTVDLSKGRFVEDEKEEVHETFRGFSHSGGEYSERVVKAKCDSLQIVLEELKAGIVILPASAKRKHLNCCIKNKSIVYVVVADNSKLFSMKGDEIWNKKGTILIHQQPKKPMHCKCGDCEKAVSSAFAMKNADNEFVCGKCQEKYINVLGVLYMKDDPRFIDARDKARKYYRAINGHKQTSKND